MLYVEYVALMMVEENESDYLEHTKSKTFNALFKTKFFCSSVSASLLSSPHQACHIHITGILFLSHACPATKHAQDETSISRATPYYSQESLKPTVYSEPDFISHLFSRTIS